MANILSPSQIASVLRQAGFPEDKLPLMTATALAESGGKPWEHNPNVKTGDNSYGLLQINMLGGMGPERRKQFGLRSNEELFDPLTNARAARKIFQNEGPNAWGAIRNGSYKQYLGVAERAVRGGGGALPAAPPPPGPPAGDSFVERLMSIAGLGGGTGGDSGFNPARPLVPSPQSVPMGDQPMRAPFKGTFTKALLGLGGGAMASPFAPLVNAIAGLNRGGMVSAPRPEAPGGTRMAAGGDLSSMIRSILGESTEAPSVRPIDMSGPVTGIVDVGKMLQGAGLRVREHPAFGGVGGHSEGSLHYDGKALDLTDWQDPGESERSWGPRKKWLAQQYQHSLSGTGAEVFGPHNDPRGHGTHIHLGLPSGGLPAGAVQELVRLRREALEKFPLRWNG